MVLCLPVLVSTKAGRPSSSKSMKADSLRIKSPTPPSAIYAQKSCSRKDGVPDVCPFFKDFMQLLKFSHFQGAGLFSFLRVNFSSNPTAPLALEDWLHFVNIKYMPAEGYRLYRALQPACKGPIQSFMAKKSVESYFFRWELFQVLRLQVVADFKTAVPRFLIVTGDLPENT